MNDKLAVNRSNVGSRSQQRYYDRSFPSRAEANRQWSANGLDNRVRLIEADFETKDPFEHAIHIERAFHAEVNSVNVIGPYSRAVSLHFCLHASIANVNVDGAYEGFFIGSGAEIIDAATGRKRWLDAEHSNSASNQTRIVQSRFYGRHPESVGFILEGGGNVLFDQTTVEGRQCKVGWQLAPRSAWSGLTLIRSWLETPLHTAIKFDGFKNFFEVTSFNMRVLPEVLLDCRGDQGSTIIFDRNNWKSVPRIRLGRETQVELGTNSFSENEFWASVERIA